MKFNKLKHLMASFVREDTLNDIDYYVVPSIAITEGVHNNILYTSTELQKFPASWNGVPITNGHPFKNGLPTEASTPEMIAEFQIGFWYNCLFEDKKLKGEIWLDKEKCESINPQIITNLKNNIPTDVSTGLFTEDIKQNGQWNGIEYQLIATNYRPDHIAILPNDVGACSWEDGAGMARINKKQIGEKMKKHPKKEETKFHINVSTLSHEDIAKQLRAILRKKLFLDNDQWLYLADVYDDYAIYEVENKTASNYYKVGYKIDENSEVVLVGDGVEVIEITIYKPKQIKTNKEANSMREKEIKVLISNKDSKWNEKDIDFLTELSDENFEKIKTNAVVEKRNAEDKMKVNKQIEETKTEKELKTNEQELKVLTADEFIKTAPKELQEVLNSSLKIHNDKKKDLVVNLKANKSCLFNDEELNSKSLDELVKLNALIKKDDYSGSGNQPAPKTNLEEYEAPQMPDMEW